MDSGPAYDVVPVQVVHDVHNDDHWEQSDVNFADEGSLGACTLI